VADSLGGDLFALLRLTLSGAAAALGIVVLWALLAPGHDTVHAAPNEDQRGPFAVASDATPPTFRFVAVWPITATPAAPTSAPAPVVNPPATTADIATIATVLGAGPAATPAPSTVATSDAATPISAETVLSDVLAADDGWAASLGTAALAPSTGSGPVDAVERFVPEIAAPVGSVLSGSSSDSGPSPAQLAALATALLAVLWTTERLRTSVHVGRHVLVTTRIARPG
jgi:hypothetical protein